MVMCNKYNRKPYRIALLHGGPGAPESITPLAKELAKKFSILEPIQSGYTIKAQLKELHELLTEIAELPVILIGWSWGAWLAYIFTSCHPALVRKLILVSCPSFEEKYARQMSRIRLARMDREQKDEFRWLGQALRDPEVANKDKIFARYGELFDRIDSYERLAVKAIHKGQFRIFESIWQEASNLRRKGRLIEYGKNIKVPVSIIHGDYDPTPYQGVVYPLSGVIGDLTLYILEKCGHTPWEERYAKDAFYRILSSIIKDNC
ncbi:MAG: alpha/beta fold hydrolase [Actinomycetota bacterium]